MSTRSWIPCSGISCVEHLDVVAVDVDITRPGLAAFATLPGLRSRLRITVFRWPLHLGASNRPLLAAVIALGVDLVLVAAWQQATHPTLPQWPADWNSDGNHGDCQLSGMPYDQCCPIPYGDARLVRKPWVAMPWYSVTYSCILRRTWWAV